MKLDPTILRLLGTDELRTLRAVEMGQRNHEIVPVPLIDSIAKLKHGGAVRAIRELLKHKLLHHENQQYDGYRLTNMGYDYLAIHTLVQRGLISGIGRKIGVGKESDVYEVSNDDGEVMILKLHRLGRTSFRAVKTKRDYLKHRNNYSWLYLSRLAALGEFAFMKALGDRGFPVPEAVDQNRHAVLMSLVDGFPLNQVRALGNPRKIFKEIMGLVTRLVGVGLVHCDFNEFNLMINDDEEITMIDFPQMVSVGHENAKELFDRDVECVIRFFRKKMGYDVDMDEEMEDARPDFDALVKVVNLGHDEEGLDMELSASGFEARHQQILQQHVRLDGQESGSDDSDAGSGSDKEDGRNGNDDHQKVERLPGQLDDLELSSSDSASESDLQSTTPSTITISRAKLSGKEREVQQRVTQLQRKLSHQRSVAKARRNANKDKYTKHSKKKCTKVVL